MDELIESFNFSGMKSALAQRNSAMQSKWEALLRDKKLPVEGWSDASIEGFLLQLSGLDGNNFEGMLGMGEREGRVCSELIRRRHFGFAHGMGRSGSLRDSQPKALGSTLLVSLTHALAVSALRVLGWSRGVLEGGLNVMPVCTGMTLAQTLLALRESDKRHRVVLLRIDQRSCIKAVWAARCELVLLEGVLEGEEVVTDLGALSELLKDGDVLGVVSCVSCFAPRAPDLIVQVSRLCRLYGVGHVVNAAYGAFSARACNLVNAAVAEGGRVDAVVMSLDKNFEVPVGGALVFGPSGEGRRGVVEKIAEGWPGRASASHIIDLFIALLSRGQKGLLESKSIRAAAFVRFRERLLEEGFSLLQTPRNDISLAVKVPPGFDSSLGAKLFLRNVSGVRVIHVGKRTATKIENCEFVDFGSHHSAWPREFFYLNVAAAVGSHPNDIETFIKKLKKITMKTMTKE